LKFIDLFSGIGGFRLALEKNGCKCVFSSEIDKNAIKNYELNFNETPYGDIKKIDPKKIPDHDILCGGFPCQPFSLAGQRKGFLDTRGTLFFDIEKIIKEKKPRCVFLENVKGLVNHDNGNTFKTILLKLTKLGYNVFYKVLNSTQFGITKNREIIFIIFFRKKNTHFEFPNPNIKLKSLKKILNNKLSISEGRLSKIALRHVNKHFKNYKKNKTKFDNPVLITEIRPNRSSIRSDGISPCLTAKMGTGGNNIPYIIDKKRTLSIRECLRLQGYPDSFKMVGSKSQNYKQIGNSVTVTVVDHLAREIIKNL